MSTDRLLNAVPKGLKSLLVATDFSSVSDKALRYALGAARHFGAKLYLFHAASFTGATMAGSEAVALSLTAALKDASALEREMVLNGLLAGLNHQVIIREGDVCSEMQDVVRRENIDLIVLGTHNRSRIGKLILGSTAEQIFRSARPAVLTIGPSCPDEFDWENTIPSSPVLFPTDFSEDSLAALPYALAFSKDRRSRLLLLHVLPLAPHFGDNSRCTVIDIVRVERKEEDLARARLRQLTEGTVLEPEPFFIVEHGNAAEAILSVARGLSAQAIVIGLHYRRHTEATSHMPWSTAYNIVARATCPVLTVRAACT